MKFRSFKQLVLAAILLLVLKGNSQSIQKQIKDIRAKYDSISAFIKTPACSIKEIEFNCSDKPAEGQILFYSKGAELRMIEVGSSDGSHSGETEQYYIWKGKLIFYFSDSGYWSFDGGQDTVIDKDTTYVPRTRDFVTQNRFYFANGKAIKCLKKEYSFSSAEGGEPSSSSIPNKEEACNCDDVLKTFSKLVKLFPKKIAEGDCPDEIADVLGN